MSTTPAASPSLKEHDPWWPKYKLTAGDKICEVKKKRYFFVENVHYSREGQCETVELVELSNRKINILKYAAFEKFMDDGVLDWWVPQEN